MNAFTNNSSLARWWRCSRSRFVSQQSPIIVGGCQRSGTTLLRVILDSHSTIACGAESSLLTGSFLPHKLVARFEMPILEISQLRREAVDHAHFVELFLTRYAENRGKRRWAEKTPQNVRHLDWIFHHFPKARFVHVLRDGRDAVCSIRTHPKYRVVDGHRLPTGIRRPLAPCIACWLQDTAAGIRWRGDKRYLEVRYEDLLDAPEQSLRRLCEFVGEPYDEAMLQFHQETGTSRNATHFITNIAATQPLTKKALGRWRDELTAQELEFFYQRAGARLEELGYERNV